MYETIPVPEHRGVTLEEVVPVCLSCGNRRLFLKESPDGASAITPDEVVAIGGRKGIKCGRCGCRNCIVLDYSE